MAKRIFNLGVEQICGTLLFRKLDDSRFIPDSRNACDGDGRTLGGNGEDGTSEVYTSNTLYTSAPIRLTALPRSRRISTLRHWEMKTNPEEAEAMHRGDNSLRLESTHRFEFGQRINTEP
jgi:hypothetical protein